MTTFLDVLHGGRGDAPLYGQPDPALDPKTNLDEYATAAARDAAECLEHAKLFPAGASRQLFLDRAPVMRARAVALLAGYYIKQEMLRSAGNTGLIGRLLRELEQGTCPAGCTELLDMSGLLG